MRNPIDDATNPESILAPSRAGQAITWPDGPRQRPSAEGAPGARWVGLLVAFLAAAVALPTQAQNLPAVSIAPQNDQYRVLMTDDRIHIVTSSTLVPTNNLTVPIRVQQDHAWFDDSLEFEFNHGFVDGAWSSLELPFVDDAPVRNGDVTITVLSGDGYELGAQSEVTVEIVAANPLITIRAAEAVYEFTEDSGGGMVPIRAETIAGAPKPQERMLIDWGVGGINFSLGFNPSDFTQSGTRWVAEKEVGITIIDDNIPEGTDRFSLQLSRRTTTNRLIKLANADGSLCEDNAAGVNCGAEIRILDDDNRAPAFDEDSPARSIAENTDAGENVGAPVTATDPEGDTLTYSLEGTDAASFDIDAATGRILTRAALDYEAKNAYTVTVRADDGKDKSATVDVSIAVIDVDPEGPVPGDIVADVTSLVLTFSEALDGGSVPGGNAFTVLVGGSPVTVTDVQVSNREVTLTLASSVVGATAVTVAYTPPATNRLRGVLLNEEVRPFGARTADVIRREVELSGERLTVNEGASATYTVVLTSQPSGRVTVTPRVVESGSDVSVSGAVTFTVLNWGSPQTVTVSAAEDADRQTDTATIAHRVSGAEYAGVTAPSLSVTVRDDEGLPTVHGEVQLVEVRRGYGGGTMGRLEVGFVDSQSSEWGTVCDDRQSEPGNLAPALACRMMGYSGGHAVVAPADARRILTRPPHPGGLVPPLAERNPDEEPIHLDDLVCLVDEEGMAPSSLLNCRYAGPRLHNCTHEEDLWVECTGTQGAATPLPALPVLSAEGAGSSETHFPELRFTVSLVPASTETVTVDYATADTSAEAIEAISKAANGDFSAATADDGDSNTGLGDYTPVSGTLTFLAGETEKTVVVAVIDDFVEDSGEIVTFRLSNPVGAQFGNPESHGVIYNREDDPPPPLTAEFTGAPEEGHDGTYPFTVTLAFSEAPTLEWQAPDDTGIEVTGGTLDAIARVSEGGDRTWTLTVTPTGDEAIGLALAATTDCGAAGAICTEDGRGLSEQVAATVARGPDPTITATFGDLPEVHGGRSFDILLTFSEDFGATPRLLEYPRMETWGGWLKKVERVTDGDNTQWRLTLKPKQGQDVRLMLVGTEDCSEENALCNADGVAVSETIEVTIPETAVAGTAAPGTVGETLWSSTLTVGQLDPFGFIGSDYGGSLSLGGWSEDGTDHTVGSVNIALFSKTSERENELWVEFSPAPADLETLTLHVDGAVHALSDAAVSGNRFAWPVGALSWTEEQQVLLRLVRTAEAPLVSGVELVADASGDRAWTSGETLEVRLTFSEAVTVSGGTPSVGVTIAGEASTLDYASGSGTAVLVFSRAVTEADGSLSEIAVTADSLALGEATVVSEASGLAAALGYSGTEATASPAEAPTVSGVELVADASGDRAWTEGETVEVRLTFSEAVTVSGGTPRVGVTIAGEAWTLDYASGSGTAVLVFSRAVTEADGSLSEIAVTADSLALGDATVVSEGSGLAAALGHSGTEATAAPEQSQQQDLPALTAEFTGAPEDHDGTTAFTLRLRFSEEFPLDWATPAATGIVVTGGTLDTVERVTTGEDREWTLTVTPEGNEDVTVTLPATADCEDDKAICTADERPLSNAPPATTVRGPAGVSIADASAVEGPGATLDFAVTMSRAQGEDVTMRYGTRSKTASAGEDYTGTKSTFTIAAGETRATIVVPVLEDALDEGEEYMEVWISRPSGGNVWIADNTARGTIINTEPPAEVSIADASAVEGPGATLDFAVTMSRAQGEDVTMHYGTRSKTATAGEDYTGTRSTFTIAAGTTGATIVVPVLDDAVDEGEEYMEVWISRPSGGNVRIEDNTARGTITNADPLPKAWLARFGRAAADQAMQAVAGRLTDPAPAGEMRLGGLERYRPLGAAEAAAAAERYREFGAFGHGAGAFGNPSGGSGLAVSGNGQGGAGPGFGGAGFGGPRATFGGPELAFGAAGGVPGMAGGAQLGKPAMGAAGMGPAAGGPAADAGIRFDLGAMLAATSFRWGTDDDGAPRLTTWGRGATTRFDGVDDGVTLSGDVVGATVGADIERGRWVAGLALSHADGRGEYSDAKSGAAGRIRSTLTSVHPYARAAVNDRLDAWGMFGYGRGGLDLGLGGDLGSIETDLESRMGALGVHGELWSSARFRLAGKSDAMWSSTRSGATEGMVATAGDAGRLRVAMQGAARFAFGAHALTPEIEVGLRYDAGDAETGYGVELGFGLGYANADLGLVLETRARMLVAHEDDGYEEWGASASVRWEPRSGGLGPRLGLMSSVGASASGVEQMWSMRDAAELAPGASAGHASRLSATLGYGFWAQRWRAVATPFLDLDASAWGRQRAGVLFERGRLGPSLEFSVERGPGGGSPPDAPMARVSSAPAQDIADPAGGDAVAGRRHEYRYQLRFSMPLGTRSESAAPVQGTPKKAEETEGKPETAEGDPEDRNAEAMQP